MCGHGGGESRNFGQAFLFRTKPILREKSFLPVTLPLARGADGPHGPAPPPPRHLLHLPSRARYSTEEWRLGHSIVSLNTNNPPPPPSPDLPFLPTMPTALHTRGSGWRIHCGVEVTDLSTNEQHTLSHNANTIARINAHGLQPKRAHGCTVTCSDVSLVLPPPARPLLLAIRRLRLLMLLFSDPPLRSPRRR